MPQRHRIAQGLVFLAERFEINRDAERRPGFVLAAIRRPIAPLSS